MADQVTTVERGVHPQRQPSPAHPLASLVLAMFVRTSALDVTDVAHTLAGALVRPSKGQHAYRIVAADVLGCLWHRGVLVRHGHGNPRRPEDGGFWYTLAASKGGIP